MSSQLPTNQMPTASDIPRPDAGGVKKFFTETLPGSFHHAVTWPLRLSLPAKIAWLLFLFLTITAIVILVIVHNDARNNSLRDALNVYWYVGVVVLVALIPWLVFRSLKLWLAGEPTKYPEIEYAWQAGLAALEEHGLDLKQIPLFLVLGSSNEGQERALMKASGRNFRVYGVPRGPAPIHWYANPDCAFLVCSEIGCLSTLSRKVRQREQEGDDGAASTSSSPEAMPGPATAPPPEDKGAQLGTLNFDSYSEASAPASTAPPPPKMPAAGGNFQGTMMFSEGEFDDAPPPAASPRAPARPAPATPPAPRRAPAESSTPFEPVVLSAQDMAEQRRRLHFLTQRVAHARFPLCPANGIATLLSFHCIEANREQADELERAVRADLEVLRAGTHLRSPVSAIVVDLEDEPGFAEMVRRVGRQRAYSQRFGRGFSLEKKATAEELAALSQHVAGAFEDWIYMLFREQDALYRPGNQQLFSLLCKIRCKLKGRLTDILAEGFGYEEARDGASSKNLFSGCYFMSIGVNEDDRAFVKGVVDKMVDEQEEIEWTEESDRLDHRYRFWTTIAAGLSLAMLASLLLLLILF